MSVNALRIFVLVVTTLSVATLAGLGQERGPIEILGVLWQHLELDEVGKLVANHCAVHQDVVLLEHELAECVDVERAAETGKKL